MHYNVNDSCRERLLLGKGCKCSLFHSINATKWFFFGSINWSLFWNWTYSKKHSMLLQNTRNSVEIYLSKETLTFRHLEATFGILGIFSPMNWILWIFIKFNLYFHISSSINQPIIRWFRLFHHHFCFSAFRMRSCYISVFDGLGNRREIKMVFSTFSDKSGMGC